MNGRTATLINKFATRMKTDAAYLKRRWKEIPWTKRHKLRRQMREVLETKKAAATDKAVA